MKLIRSHVLIWILVIAVAMMAPKPVSAGIDDDLDFILRVRPGTILAVAQKYRLEVEDRIAGQEVYLVEYEGPDLQNLDDDDDDDDDGDDGNDDDDDDNSGTPGSGSGSGGSAGSGSGSGTNLPANLPLAQFLAMVRSDANVISFEVNENVDLPEDDDDAVAPPVSDAPLSGSLGDRTLNNFFGGTAWNGYVRQAAAAAVKLTDSHQAGRTGSGIVAVIDTGVDPDHPALRDALVAGYDFTIGVAGNATEMNDIDSGTNSLLQQSTVAFLDGVPVTLDKRYTVIVRQSTVAFLDGSKLPSSFGHGTMVAGLVRLAAPTAKIMPLKAFRADGRSDLFHIMAAIYFAVGRGAKVVNMSFSLPTESVELTRAINFAASNGAVCVSSVGNQGSSTPVYPAISPNVIGVASVSNTGARSAFSNYGTPLVSLAAPGEGVLTTFPGGTYAAAWGTSYSAPLVAGTVAVIAQDQPGLTQSQAEFAVRQATPLTAELGAGMLNVPMALGMVTSVPPAPSAPGSTSTPSSNGSATAVNRSQGARCLTSSGAGRSASACAIR